MYKTLIILIILALVVIFFAIKLTVKKIKALRELKNLNELSEKVDRYQSVLDDCKKFKKVSSLDLIYSEFSSFTATHKIKQSCKYNY